MPTCEICGKGRLKGNKKTKTHGVTYRSRNFQKPNLTRKKLDLGNGIKSVWVCNKCRKTMNRKG